MIRKPVSSGGEQPSAKAAVRPDFQIGNGHRDIPHHILSDILRVRRLQPGSTSDPEDERLIERRKLGPCRIVRPIANPGDQTESGGLGIIHDRIPSDSGNFLTNSQQILLVASSWFKKRVSSEASRSWVNGS